MKDGRSKRQDKHLLTPTATQVAQPSTSCPWPDMVSYARSLQDSPQLVG